MEVKWQSGQITEEVARPAAPLPEWQRLPGLLAAKLTSLGLVPLFISIYLFDLLFELLKNLKNHLKAQA